MKDGVKYRLNDDGTATVIANSPKYEGKIKILSSVTDDDKNKYTVTGIGKEAFYTCTNLTSIEIPDSVANIGNSAFSGCEGLTKVELNKKDSQLKTIDEDAFHECKALTSIIIPNSVESIGKTAFYNCTGLTRITIPDNVTSIAGNAFVGCSKLTEINVDENNLNYSSANNVLFNEDNNKKTLIAYPAGKNSASYEIPYGVTGIGGSAFYECKDLTSITIPVSVESIGNSAFSGCSGLTSITIPDGVTGIGSSAFFECNNLVNITLSEKIETIGDSAFWGCNSLAEITIPTSVTSIGNLAFCNCICLTSITIPDSVINIGMAAFSGCDNLKTVIYKGTLDQWNALVSSSRDNLPLNANFTFNNLKPEAETITHNSITLKTLASLGNNIRDKYYIKEGNVWTESDSPEFKDLEPQKQYTFKIEYVKGGKAIGTSLTEKFTTDKYTPPYTPPANPTIDITGKDGGTVIYDRIKHTVTITPNDDYLVKEITLNGTTVPVTDGAMVLENIYGWSRISVTFEPKPEPAFEPDKYISELKFKANSSKTSKGNIRIKVTSVTDDNGNKIDLTELKDKGYTVKFKYYRSTQKASKHTAKVEKSADINSYINTSGKKGTKYYYKVRVMVYDADGSLVAKSDLKQCSYAARIWSK